MTSPNAWSHVLIVVPLIGAALATMMYSFRLYSRHISGVGFRTEDLLSGIGLVFSYGVTICVIIAAFNGVGSPIWTLQSGQGGRITLVFWLAQKFWPVSQVFIKISIITLLRRLLGSVDRYRIATTVLIIFTVVWGITALLGNILQCIPPQYFWDRSIRGYCIRRQNVYFMIIGGISLAEDIAILCLPLPLVWHLQMVRREKIQITILFSLGALVCIFSLLRLVEFHNYITTNLSFHGALESIWTLLELNFATICGSLVLMKPVFQVCAGAVKSRCSQYSGKVSSPRSSDYDGMFRPWTLGAASHHDTCSEVRTQAFSVPIPERPADVHLCEWGSNEDSNSIVVDTAIDQEIWDISDMIRTETMSSGGVRSDKRYSF